MATNVNVTGKATEPSTSNDSRGSAAQTPQLLWLPLAMAAFFWVYMFAAPRFDMPISTTFLSTMALALLTSLVFCGWWLFLSRTVCWRDRVLGLVMLIGGAAATSRLGDPSLGIIGCLLIGMPTAITAWLVWMLASKRFTLNGRRLGSLVVVAGVWLLFSLVRVEGVDGSNQAAVAWRFQPSAEQRYLAERTRSTTTGSAADQPGESLVAGEGDWTDFRGPLRQGALHGVKIATDWQAHPPKELWRQKIGPAWSSVLIIGNRLFTQEQRGEAELTVCLNAATGRELWAHADEVRWSDGQAGAGPRATPSFSDGRLYTLGGTGVLNCLDAASGKLLWTRNIAKDSGAPTPMWGFSSSPLVEQGIVSVYAGGPDDKGLVAYDASTGEPAWTAATGPVSYSSTQLASFSGDTQALLLSDTGVVAVDPRSGERRWEFAKPAGGIWRVVQPHQLADESVLVGSEDLGLVRLDIGRSDNAWTVSERWSTRGMRPAFNDFVVSEGHAYGFDEAILSCVDLETGKRKWKGGRFGHGQLLLLADQPLLVVVGEKGELALVAARPDKFEELARIQAVEGKTWNHPVVAHGRLYVRNDQEMVCYELTLE